MCAASVIQRFSVVPSFDHGIGNGGGLNKGPKQDTLPNPRTYCAGQSMSAVYIFRAVFTPTSNVLEHRDSSRLLLLLPLHPPSLELQLVDIELGSLPQAN
jgi:hypothetical protein